MELSVNRIKRASPASEWTWADLCDAGRLTGATLSQQENELEGAAYGCRVRRDAVHGMTPPDPVRLRRDAVGGRCKSYPTNSCAHRGAGSFYV